MTISAAEAIVHEAQHELAHALPNLDDMSILPVTSARDSGTPHAHH
jgi:hypothetical protein